MFRDRLDIGERRVDHRYSALGRRIHRHRINPNALDSDDPKPAGCRNCGRGQASIAGCNRVKVCDFQDDTLHIR